MLCPHLVTELGVAGDIIYHMNADPGFKQFLLISCSAKPELLSRIVELESEDWFSLGIS